MSISRIRLNIAEKIKDPSYRRSFFREQTKLEIAQAIVKLRKARRMTQTDMATATGTTQSAISRIERADYMKWRVQTLLVIAGALDAKLCVKFEPAERVVRRYRKAESAATP